MFIFFSSFYALFSFSDFLSSVFFFIYICIPVVQIIISFLTKEHLSSHRAVIYVFCFLSLEIKILVFDFDIFVDIDLN